MLHIGTQTHYKKIYTLASSWTEYELDQVEFTLCLWHFLLFWALILPHSCCQVSLRPHICCPFLKHPCHFFPSFIKTELFCALVPWGSLCKWQKANMIQVLLNLAVYQNHVGEIIVKTQVPRPTLWMRISGLHQESDLQTPPGFGNSIWSWCDRGHTPAAGGQKYLSAHVPRSLQGWRKQYLSTEGWL